MKIYRSILLFLFIPFVGCKTGAQTLSNSSSEKKENIEQLTSIPFLPDPLVLNEGNGNTPITHPEQWNSKRNWIKEQYQHWVCGTFPPSPGAFSTKIISEKTEDRVKIRIIELHFGPNQKGKLTIELMIPPLPEKLPVFMTQWNHRGWAQIAVRRGYIGCVYAGADDKDDTKNFDALYPEYSFSKLMKRAWASSRAVDYLYTLPQVDTLRIGITGHSRNGKQSLLAGAFDERIKAVVSSSGGTGGENPFRYTDDPYDNENIDDITKNFPDWFHPNLRLFIGKEDKLPVDQNSLISLIAPRGLLLSSAITETEGGPWGIEQAYESAKEVYRFLNAGDKLGILFRNGRHGTSARDIENYIDFFDFVFGRSIRAPENKLYYDYSFQKWVNQSGEHINPLDFPNHVADQKNTRLSTFESKPGEIQKKINWLLGEEPPGITSTGKISIEKEKNSGDYLAEVIEEATPAPGVKKQIIGPYNAAGEYLWADLYYSQQINPEKQKLPLVIFLHEYAHTTGYRRRIDNLINTYTQNGFAVLAFDMIGYGTRIEEFKNFYNRYPKWSIMGKMVADTRMLITDACSRMKFIDSTNIFLVGYSLGGTVALFTSALDKRVKGTAVVSAFDSWRTTDNTTEGIRHFSHLHGLIPRLGFFAGYEERIPVDFDAILSVIAPRPLFIIAPMKDRLHPAEEVKQVSIAVANLYKQINSPSHFLVKQPNTYNHFTEEMQEEIASWLKKIKKE